MKNIVILGAGTGGALVSNMLSRKLNLKEWDITVIDKAEDHLYQPGLLFLPFKFYDYKEKGDIAKPISGPLPNSVNFVKSDVKLIDHENKKVETDNGDFPYDWLVSAMGCHLAPEEIDGLEDAMTTDRVHTFYDLEGALGFQDALENMKEGKLVLNIAEMPIKCPVAPIEFVFLADYFFTQKGNRNNIEISLVTPLSGAFTKPIATRILTEIAERKNIKIVPDFSIGSIDTEKKQIDSFDNKSVDYDLLCTIPPNLGPDVIEESGLGDGVGYALTDPKTLKSKKSDSIFIIGDNSNVSTSKAGSVVHFEAETVVENLLREIEGKKALPSFDGHSNCFIESGHDKALLIDFNYDMEPLEGSFPLPGLGPFSLLKESYINHMGKLAFKWIYWNMLIQGRMPDTPLVPSHMSFMGKNVADVPQIHRSRTMKLSELMTDEVVTVMQGSSIADAAKLLAKHNISGLPVIDVDQKLIGVITEADFLSAMDINAETSLKQMFELVINRQRKKKKMGTFVDDLMTKNPITMREDDPVDKAIHVMDANKIKRIIVTDKDNYVKGVVSRRDIMKLFLMK